MLPAIKFRTSKSSADRRLRLQSLREKVSFWRGNPAPVLNISEHRFRCVVSGGFLSESSANSEEALRAARREAEEWKAKAIATQKAAESLKEKARLLRDKAHQTVEQNRELSNSLSQFRSRSAEHLAQIQQLTEEKSLLELALAASDQEKRAALGSLVLVEQQLALYMRALEETRQGGDLEQIRSAVRVALENPTAETALRDEVRRTEQRVVDAEVENRNLRQEIERLNLDISYLEQEITARDSLLRERELEAVAHYGELDLTKSLIQEMRRTVEGQDRQLIALRADLEQARRRLGEQERALMEKQSEIEVLEADSQSLVESFHQEAESLRAEIEFLTSEKLELEQRLDPPGPYSYKDAEIERLQRMIGLLEDQRSDLEIVNAELYQRIAELES